MTTTDSYKLLALDAINECLHLLQLLQKMQKLTKSASVNLDAVILAVNSMIKCGCLTEAQSKEAQNLLKTDANASLRTIKGLCLQFYNANTLIKTGSLELSCGNLVSLSKKANTVTPHSDLTSVARILGLPV